jgi:hypothetical protein
MNAAASARLTGHSPQELGVGSGITTEDQYLGVGMAPDGPADRPAALGAGGGRDAAGVDGYDVNAVAGARTRRTERQGFQQGADRLRLVLVDLAAYGCDHEAGHGRISNGR